MDFVGVQRALCKPNGAATAILRGGREDYTRKISYKIWIAMNVVINMLWFSPAAMPPPLLRRTQRRGARAGAASIYWRPVPWPWYVGVEP